MKKKTNRPHLIKYKTKKYFVYKKNKLKKMADSKLEVCQVLLKLFKKSNYSIRDLEENGWINTYKEMSKITTGKRGSVGDKKLKEFGQYLGVEVKIEKRYTIIEHK